jgi:hypothetical protein
MNMANAGIAAARLLEIRKFRIRRAQNPSSNRNSPPRRQTVPRPRAERLTAELRPVEGQRDKLLAELLDLEGADSQRPVAVR